MSIYGLNEVNMNFDFITLDFIKRMNDLSIFPKDLYNRISGIPK
jgi:hypothetical protein